MAIYHCSIKVISRGKGKSAVAAAAYRAGEKITNEFDGMTHDYTHKGGVVHTEILLPDHARRILDELTAQNAPTAPIQGAETAAQGNTPPAAKTAHTAREGGADGSMNGGGLQG